MKENITYAGFWIRFLASLLDTLFLAVPVGILIYFLSDGAWFDFSQFGQNMANAMNGNPHAMNVTPHTSTKWELLFEVAVLSVTMIFWKKWRGATPGKKLLNVKIVDAKTFQDISNKQAIIRSFGYILSSLPFLFGFIIAAFRRDKRTFHDFLAQTAVIYDDRDVSSF
ncbi:MAG: RDD family protein [Campylobacterales bacterium]|nr:RDD family protein [Campylobacterales bacterium]